MKTDEYALSVVAALKRKQKPKPPRNVYRWREDWWEAWLEHTQEQRAAKELRVNKLRAESASYEARLAANTDYPTVRPAVEEGLQMNNQVIQFWELMTAYLDAGASEKRLPAAALSEFANAHLDTHWMITFLWTVDVSEGAYLQLRFADKWRAFEPERNAGAFAVRMQRIADRGSATPLDRMEAQIMMLKELRFHDLCTIYRYDAHHYKRTYQYVQPLLNAQKCVAKIDAVVCIYEAELIGDTAGIKAGHQALEDAAKLFGGNFKNGRIVWQNELSDDERIAWEQWKVENNWTSIV